MRAAEPPAPESAQGTLYLCRTAETAQRIADRFPGLDAPQGSRPIPAAYDAVIRCDQLRAIGPYRRVILCDGLLCPQELCRLSDLYPQAEFITLPRSAALQSRLRAMQFSVDELRVCYVRLRGGQRPDLREPRQAAMAAVLQSVDLVGPQLQLLPARKCDPSQSPLYQMIQGSEPHGHGL